MPSIWPPVVVKGPTAVHVALLVSSEMGPVKVELAEE